jgi:hypothetical protein
MKPIRRMFLVSAVAVSGALIAFAGTASAVTVEWTGNGTTNGQCTDNTADPNVSNTQEWLFILTNPGPGPWDLTATFQDSGKKTASGVQQGNGSVHFTVITSVDDTLLSASATNGTDQSNLTVSHCQPGPPSATTTTTTTTTTTVTTAAPQVSGQTVTQQPAAAAAPATVTSTVTARPTFTG